MADPTPTEPGVIADIVAYCIACKEPVTQLQPGEGPHTCLRCRAEYSAEDVDEAILDAAREILTDLTGERVCVLCGCTDSAACEEGCEWVSLDPPVCSACADKAPTRVEELLSATALSTGQSPEAVLQAVLISAGVPRETVQIAHLAVQILARPGHLTASYLAYYLVGQAGSAPDPEPPVAHEGHQWTRDPAAPSEPGEAPPSCQREGCYAQGGEPSASEPCPTPWSEAIRAEGGEHGR